MYCIYVVGEQNKSLENNSFDQIVVFMNVCCVYVYIHHDSCTVYVVCEQNKSLENNSFDQIVVFMNVCCVYIIYAQSYVHVCTTYIYICTFM